MTASSSIDATTIIADATSFLGLRPLCQMANGAEITGVIDGNGPPLLLLHGHPQNHMIWHKVARELARDYTVVATDLRGYGAPSKPADSVRHAEYSKCTMTQDQVEVIRAPDSGRLWLCAYDCGACVAYRLCVDHPLHIEHAMPLDIASTLAMYEYTDMVPTSVYWHWFFLTRPLSFPETLINATPDFYIGKLTGLHHASPEPLAPETMATYAAAMYGPICVHAIYENHRAATTVNLERDRADRGVGKRASVLLRVLQGEHGVIQRRFKPSKLWKAVTDSVSGGTVPCGYYVPEEAPEALFEEMCTYFA